MMTYANFSQPLLKAILLKKGKQIIFNFEFAGATIKIKFKLLINSPVAFSWLTADGTISIIDAIVVNITMNSKK
jgi:hypothetical protein